MGRIWSDQHRYETWLLVETAAAEEPELPPLAKRTSRAYGAARLTLFEHP